MNSLVEAVRLGSVCLLPVLIVVLLLLLQRPQWLGGQGGVRKGNKGLWIVQFMGALLASGMVILVGANAVILKIPKEPVSVATSTPTSSIVEDVETRVPFQGLPIPPTQTPALAPPENLTAIRGFKIIQLYWNDRSEYETGYRVYHSRGNNAVSDGNWQVAILQLPANTTSWTHKNPPCNVENWYYVVALREAKESVESNLAHAFATCHPEDTPTPPYPCAGAPARITLPHAGDVFAPNADVRIEGAMCREGYSYYEVQFRRVDCQTKQPIGLEDSWATIGIMESAPVGCSGDVFLAEWPSRDRSQQHISAGCYQLTTKMRKPNWNTDLLDKSCWVVIELK